MHLRTFAVALLAAASSPVLATGNAQISSREDYRRCLSEGDRLEDERSGIESSRRRLESAQKDLQALAKLHAANRSRVTVRDAAAVAAYNQRVKELNELSSRLNDQATSLLAKQNQFNAKISESNQRCAGMAITLDDHEAVLLDRVKQAAGQ